MAASSSSGDPFAESDDEDGGGGKKAASKEAKDPFEGSLLCKSGRNAGSTLYYVNYNKAKNGNGLQGEERNELLANIATGQAEESSLKASIAKVAADTKKLLSEPMNDELAVRLEKEGAALTELKEAVEAARKLQVNEKHKKQTKRRIENMTAQWRKRRRICMESLIALEENTDGTISVKKCLAGDGQIEIDSDEQVAKHAVEFGKKKKMRKTLPNKKRRMGSMKPVTSNAPVGIPPDENFVAVILDSQGTIKRVRLDDDEDA